jgi:hypothetical protein
MHALLLKAEQFDLPTQDFLDIGEQNAISAA